MTQRITTGSPEPRAPLDLNQIRIAITQGEEVRGLLIEEIERLCGQLKGDGIAYRMAVNRAEDAEAALSRSAAPPLATPLERYDASHERFQRGEIRALKQTAAALVRTMMEAGIVPRVSPLDLAADPPTIKNRLDPATGDTILWLPAVPEGRASHRSEIGEETKP